MVLFPGALLWYATVSFAETSRQVGNQATRAKPDTNISPVSLSLSPEKAEVAISEIIKRAFKAARVTGAGIHLKNRKLEEITLQGAMLRALEKNLTIKRSHLGEEISKAALLEAKAVFDPVFNIAGTFSNSDTYGRSEESQRWKKATKVVDGENVIEFEKIDWVNLDGTEESGYETDGSFDHLVFRDTRDEGYGPHTSTSSSTQYWPPTDTFTYDFLISQDLPWGSSLSLGVTAIDQEAYWKIPEYEKNGNYDRSWTSSMTFSGFVPLPYTKNFGAYSSLDTYIKLADVDKDKAYWAVKAAINTTLLRVDHAFWDVVKSIRNLQVTIENTKNMENLVKFNEELFKAKRATKYGRSQMGAELERIKALEEIAWNDYVLASNELNDLLNHDREVIYLPGGYSINEEKPMDFDPDTALETGLKSNPELLMTREDVKYAVISMRFSETQARPDLNFKATLSSSQSNQVYGHESLGGSLSDILNGDKKYFSLGLLYTYPWLNKALNAAFSQAKGTLKQQKILVRIMENGVSLSVNNALTDIYSSRARLKITRDNLRLAEMAYENAGILRTANRVTEFEMVLKNGEVLDANYTRIAAVIDNRKAETALLAAEGILAEKYAERTAQDDFDRHRIGQLAAHHALSYFGPAN